jgi:hypothetical protein
LYCIKTHRSIFAMERQPRKRRRVALSCELCRQRKVKCDRMQPCKNCISSKAQCIYKTYFDNPVNSRPELPNSEIRRDSTTTASPSAPSPLAQPQQDFIKLYPTLQSRVPGFTATASQQKTSGAVDQWAPGVLIEDLLKRVQTIEGTLEGHTDVRDRPNHLHNSNSLAQPADSTQEKQSKPAPLVPALKDSNIMLNKTRTMRCSHWMGVAQEVSQKHSHQADTANWGLCSTANSSKESKSLHC